MYIVMNNVFIIMNLPL